MAYIGLRGSDEGPLFPGQGDLPDTGPGGISGRGPSGFEVNPTPSANSTPPSGFHQYDPGIPLQEAVDKGRAEYQSVYGSQPQTQSSPTPSPSPTIGSNGLPGYYRPDGGWQVGTPQPAAAPTNPFDDPATKPFIDMLNQRISALNTPHQNPALDQLNSYLQQYFQRLQGPAYTDADRALMQTQALDPLETQRGAARNQVLQRLAARGIAPSSGIAEKALQDIDKQFNQIRTQTQAGFANKEIDLNRINAQQAAGVGQLMANLDQTQFANQEQRANQAVQYAQVIPDLARQRLQDAIAVMQGQNINPTSLIAQTMQGNQFQDAQSQQMMMGLFSLLPQLLNVNWSKLFGG